MGSADRLDSPSVQGSQEQETAPHSAAARKQAFQELVTTTGGVEAARAIVSDLLHLGKVPDQQLGNQYRDVQPVLAPQEAWKGRKHTGRR